MLACRALRVFQGCDAEGGAPLGALHSVADARTDGGSDLRPLASLGWWRQRVRSGLRRWWPLGTTRHHMFPCVGSGCSTSRGAVPSQPGTGASFGRWLRLPGRVVEVVASRVVHGVCWLRFVGRSVGPASPSAFGAGCPVCGLPCLVSDLRPLADAGGDGWGGTGAGMRCSLLQRAGSLLGRRVSRPRRGDNGPCRIGLTGTCPWAVTRRICARVPAT